jgi:hypothetical protein
MMATTKKDNPDLDNLVCTYCGSKLEFIETVDNYNKPAEWLGCKNCDHFNNGTDFITFRIAEYLVFKDDVRYYSFKEKPEEWISYNWEFLKDLPKESRCAYYARSQISGFISLIERIKYIESDLINKDQPKEPLQQAENRIREIIKTQGEK